jgi:hypothetical protein
VVGDGKSQVGTTNLSSGDAESFERLRRRNFMDQVPIDVDQARAIIAPSDHVRVPDLLIKSARAAVHPQQPRFMAISS